MLTDSVAYEVAKPPADGRVRVEHPTGFLDVGIETDGEDSPRIVRTAAVRTARMTLDGIVYPAPVRSTQED